MELIHRLKFFVGKVLKKHPLLFAVSWQGLRKVGLFLPHDKSFFGFEYLTTESGGLFLDIGANNGLSALSFHRINRKYKIFSIEVNQYNEPDLKRVKKKIQRFDYKIIGVGSCRSTIDLHTPLYWGYPITLLTSLNLDWLKAEVRRTFLPRYIRKITYVKQSATVVLLDDVSAELNLAPDIVKIDVEGFDVQVLKGMVNTVARYRPYIMLEYSPDYFEELLDYCQKFRYQIFLFNNELRYFENFSNRKAIEQYERGDFAVNPFCIPEEKTSLLPRCEKL